MTPELEGLLQAIGDFWVNFVFGATVLVAFGLLLLAVLYAALLVQTAWRWLTRATWHDVVTSAERRALK